MATTFEIRKIVSLLMKRPITEDLAIEVKSIDGYKHLEITNGNWDLDGIEDEMTTGEEHGWIEFLLLARIGNFILEHALGRMYPGDVTFVLEGTPGNIQVSCEPDVAFIREADVTPTSKFVYRAPDFAVEIISPSQDLEEMRAKIHRYFDYGTHQAWLVIPETREIEVYTADGSMRLYEVGQTLSGGDLFPGFSLDVRKVFER